MEVTKNMKTSKTHFVRDKKGKVIRVERSGYDTSLDSKIKEFELSKKHERKLRRQHKHQKAMKAGKKARKTMKQLAKNIDNANDWFNKNCF